MTVISVPSSAATGAYIPDAGTIEINGTDVTRVSEYKRAKYIGRVFQDPLKGTAAGMQVEENLLLASRRGESRRLKWAFSAGDHEKYRDMVARLDLGLEDRLGTRIGLLSGFPTPRKSHLPRFPAASARRSRCLWRP